MQVNALFWIRRVRVGAVCPIKKKSLINQYLLIFLIKINSKKIHFLACMMSVDDEMQLARKLYSWATRWYISRVIKSYFVQTNISNFWKNFRIFLVFFQCRWSFLSRRKETSFSFLICFSTTTTTTTPWSWRRPYIMTILQRRSVWWKRAYFPVSFSYSFKKKY